jgi:hypothetical protein
LFCAGGGDHGRRTSKRVVNQSGCEIVEMLRDRRQVAVESDQGELAFINALLEDLIVSGINMPKVTAMSHV